MPTTITKPLLRRLFARFGIMQSGDPVMQLTPGVMGVYDADQLVAQAKAQTTQGATTNRTDTYTVPAGKEWRLVSSILYRAQSGSCDINATFASVTVNQIRQIAAFTNETYLQWERITMREGDSIIFVFAAGTSGSIGSTILYEEYDAA